MVGGRQNRTVEVLRSAILSARDVRIAVAFVSCSGLELVWPAINSILDSGAEVEFMVGLDSFISEPEALLQLYELAGARTNADLYCYWSTQGHGIYHPKLYLLLGETEGRCLLGSSNLTRPGLAANLEVNAMVVAPRDSEFISDALEMYNGLKFRRDRVIPDRQYLDLYAELFRRNATLQRRPLDRDLMRAFRERMAVLHRPPARRKDIVGWMELVYDALPAGEFGNQDAYAHEDAFSKAYPGNLHIRAKIRQQLQNLAKLGFLEHLGQGRWRKL
ncbi:MAG TPA: phospholipase D-like domain-containing protein [Candidatus Cryosericum sp.]|nr:phospholipase D-like domain-containing protein [Candidatus Cryosericum sp.]